MLRFIARHITRAIRGIRSTTLWLVSRKRARKLAARDADRRARLSLNPMEDRNHTGNVVGGLALAALGYQFTDPLQAMALAVGDFALLAAPPTDVAPVATVGDPPQPLTRWLSDDSLARLAEPEPEPSRTDGRSRPGEPEPLYLRPADLLGDDVPGTSPVSAPSMPVPDAVGRGGAPDGTAGAGGTQPGTTTNAESGAGSGGPAADSQSLLAAPTNPLLGSPTPVPGASGPTAPPPTVANLLSSAAPETAVPVSTAPGLPVPVRPEKVPVLPTTEAAAPHVVAGAVEQTRPQEPRTELVARAPLSFEAAAPRDAVQGIAYVARGAGYALDFDRHGITLTLSGKGAEKRATLRFEFAGSPGADPVAEAPQPGPTNYLVGNDPTGWRHGVTHFGRVVYRDVLPGIDVAFYGSTENRLEYDVTVRPGADPSAFRLRTVGVDKETVDGAGNLVQETRAGIVTHRAPVLYQDRAGVRAPINGTFTRAADGTLSLSAGAYDRSMPLVIDPVIDYSHAVGDLVPQAVAVDGSENVFVAGEILDTGTWTTDLFLREYDPDGTLLFTDVYGGSGNETGARLALTGDGKPVLVGTTDSSDLPVENELYSSNQGGTDALVAAYSADGSALDFASYFGGSGNDYGRAVAVSSSGLVYLAGETGSEDLPTVDPAQPALAGGTDAFLSILNVSSPALVQSGYLGGSGNDSATAVAVNDSGRAFLAGTTSSGDLPVTAGAFQHRYGGGASDGFAAAVDPDGTRAYLTFVGGLVADTVTGAALNSESNLYLTGATRSADYPTVDPYQAVRKAGVSADSAFVTKLNADGTGVVFSTVLDGTGGSSGVAVGVDAADNAVVFGQAGTGFPLLNALGSAPLYGGQFLTRFAPNGLALSYSTYTNTLDVTQGNALAVDSGGNAYLAGSSSSWPDGVVVKVKPALPSGATPVITGIVGSTGLSAFDSHTPSGSVTLRGEAPPGAAVRVTKSNGTTAGTGTADAAGVWTVAVSGLAEGAHAFTASLDQSYSSTNRPSGAFVVTVDQTAPTVVLDAPASTTSRRPEVFVRAADRNGLPDGTTVELEGPWSGVLTAPLQNGVAVFELPELGLGSASLTAHVWDRAGNEGTASGSVTVAAAPDPWSVSAAPVAWEPGGGDPLLQSGDVGIAVGLDLDQSPGTGTYLDAALTYHSGTVDPRPVIQARIDSDSAASLPATIRAVLTWDGVDQTERTFSTTGFVPGEVLTLAVRPDDAASTGRHLWSLAVTLDYGGGTTTALDPVSGVAFAVNNSDSAVGPGWTLPVDQLVPIAAQGSEPAGIMRLFASGGWRFYEEVSSGTYASPAEDNGTLAQLSGGTYEYTAADGTVVAFDADGLQTSIVSADGSETSSFTYDTSGLLTGIALPDGSSATLSYTTGGLLDTVTAGSLTYSVGRDWTGRVTGISVPLGSYSFTYAGELIASSTLGILTESWAYADGLAVSHTVGAADETRFTPVAALGLDALARGEPVARSRDAFDRLSVTTMDQLGRVLSYRATDGTVTTYTRDAAGRVLTATDALGRTTTYTRDSLGYVTEEADPGSVTRSWEYDGPFHALTEYTDARGGVTQYEHDSQGHVTTITNALGKVTTQTWSSGLLTSITDPLSHTTTFAYDTARRLTRVTDPLGNYTETSYDTNGNVATVLDARGNVTTYVHDAAGLLTSRTDALNHTATWSYVYGTDLVSSFTDERNVTFSTAYDDHGQRVSASYGSYSLTVLNRWVRDRTGGLIAEVDGNGNATHTLVAGSMAVVTDAKHGQAISARDAIGRTTATRNQLGAWTAYTYDTRGFMASVTDPLGGVTAYTHDNAGNVLSSFDPLGVETRTDYDLLGRVTSVTEAVDTAAERTSSTTYDDAGRVTVTTDVRGVVTLLGYDAADRLTTRIEAFDTPEEREFDFTPDENVNVTDATDPNGVVTHYTYDALNRVTAATEGYGTSTPRTTTYSYDELGHLTGKTDALGRSSSWYYNDLGLLWIASTGSSLTCYHYDPAGNVIHQAVADIGGSGGGMTLAQVFTYDELNQAVREEENGLSNASSDPTLQSPTRVVETVRDAVGNPVLTLGPRSGQVTQFINDALGRTTVVKEKVSQVSTTEVWRTTTTTYDAGGNAASVTDALSHTTSFVRDSLNRITSVEEPLSKTTSRTYDAAGNVLTATDALGNVTKFTYDALNRNTTATEAYGTALARTTTTAYDIMGNAVRVTDPLGGVTTITYDTVLYRKTSVTDPASRTTTITSDILGRVSSVTDPAGRRTDYEYDADDRVKKETRNAHLSSGLQTVFETAYAFGFVVQRKVGGTAVASYVVDPWGNPLQIQDASGNLRLSYDEAGNLVSSSDGYFGGGNTTTYEYDLANQRTKATDALSHSATFTYYADGRLSSQTDRNGRRRDFTRDALGRVTTESWFTAGSAAAGTITSTYDLNNDLLTAANGAGTLTYTYDVLNRVKTAQDVFGITLTYTFDALNRRTGVQDSLGGQTATTYTADGQVSSFSMTQTGFASVGITRTYNSAGEMTQQALGSTGLYTDFTRDSGSGRLTEAKTRTSARLIETLGWSYDPVTGLSNQEARDAYVTASNPAATSGGTPTETLFTYVTTLQHDTIGQLTAVGSQSYSYDTGMNRTASGLTFGAGNRLLQDTLWDYTYDNEGNLTQRALRAGGETWNYTYDHLNRMVSAAQTLVVGSSSVTITVTYTYDAAGRRVTRTMGSTATNFEYDGDVVWADLSGTSTVAARYARPGHDELVARVDGSRRLWYVTDRAGAVVAVLDDSGAAVERVRDGGYNALDKWAADDTSHSGYVPDASGSWSLASWSQTTAQMNAVADDRWRSAAREWDPFTKLQYVGGRFYDEESGRFLSEAVDGLAGANAYRYAGNSPKNVEVQRSSSGSDSFKTVSDFFAGAADGLTFGLTASARQAGGYDDAVDYASAAYARGTGAGRALLTAIATGGASGALSGLGVGVWGTAAIGGGVGGGAYVVQAAVAGEPITAGGLLGAVVGGGLGGLAGVGLARLGMGWGAMIGGGAAAGAVSGAATSLVQQFVDTGSVNFEAAGRAAAWGAVGGAIGGAAFKGIGGRFGLLSKESMACGMSWGNMLKFTGASALAGTAGGLVGDVVTQLGQMATGERDGFSLRQTLAATVAGAAGGAGGYLAARALFRACFVAGTPVLTPEGWKKIEDLLEGDLVLSRSEFDPLGAVVARRVLQTFVRVSPVLNLHAGGRIIGTTGEHPFWVEQKGWTPARELRIGDVLVSHDGQRILVEGVADSGRIEAVYNVEVEEHHTYFVGCESWGFSLWAHNYDNEADFLKQEGHRFRTEDEARLAYRDFHDEYQRNRWDQQFGSRQDAFNHFMEVRAIAAAHIQQEGEPFLVGRVGENFDQSLPSLTAPEEFRLLVPGDFAGDFVPDVARPRGTLAEKEAVQSLGPCHHCGEPITARVVLDHQPPSELVPLIARRLKVPECAIVTDGYPHCRSCMAEQGPRTQQARDQGYVPEYWLTNVRLR